MDSFEFDGMTILLIASLVIGLIIIGGLIHYISDLNNKLKEEINNIEDKIPECPKCELECPKCELTCPEVPKCPSMPENKDCPKCTEGDKECPPCAECPDINCPSVDEIVNGVFPGRNTGVISGDRYSEVDPANSHDGLSISNFYEQEYNFPMDSILNPGSPIRSYNKKFDSELLNNSYENENVNNSESVSLSD